MKTYIQKCIISLIVIATFMVTPIVTFAADLESSSSGNDELITLFDSMGSTIAIDSTTANAQTKSVKISLFVPENQKDGVFFRASALKNPNASYRVVVHYPDGKTYATLGFVKGDGVYLTSKDIYFISSGTYVFDFQLSSSSNNDLTGFIAAIYKRNK